MLNWSTTDKVGTNGVKILVYGGSGAGKTRLIGTLPKPVIASAESGLLSLRQMKIPYAQISNMTDLTEFYHWCVQNVGKGYFDSIGLDSISEIAEVMLQNEKKIAKDPRQAYGELIVKCVEMVRLFRDIQGAHVYISAKSEFSKDDTGRVMFMPSMPGSKLGQQLAYYFDEVFALNQVEWEGKVYPILQTQATPQYVAKDRSGALNPQEAPDLGKVISKILGAN